MGHARKVPEDPDGRSHSLAESIGSRLMHVFRVGSCRIVRDRADSHGYHPCRSYRCRGSDTSCGEIRGVDRIEIPVD